MAGKELKSLYSISYRIENTGEAPILKTDFSEDLKVSFSDYWEILALKNLATNPAELSPEWEKVNYHEIRLKPLLMNAGDRFGLEIYLSRIEGDAAKPNRQMDQLRGTWTVRIPNLPKIDFKNPFSPSDKTKQPPKTPDTKRLLKTIFRDSGGGVETLWTAGFLFFANEWGVYVICALSVLMMYVYLTFFYSIGAQTHYTKHVAIFWIILICVFSFAASESYVTFFALLGKGVPALNYVFMSLYVVSIIALILKNKATKIGQGFDSSTPHRQI
jgi:hypothetical protein